MLFGQGPSQCVTRKNSKSAHQLIPRYRTHKTPRLMVGMIRPLLPVHLSLKRRPEKLESLRDIEASTCNQMYMLIGSGWLAGAFVSLKDASVDFFGQQGPKPPGQGPLPAGAATVSYESFRTTLLLLDRYKTLPFACVSTAFRLVKDSAAARQARHCLLLAFPLPFVL